MTDTKEARQTYVVNADAQGVFRFDEKDRLVEKRIAKRGEEVELSDAEARNLLRDGAILKKEDAKERGAAPQGPSRAQSEPGDWAAGGPGKGDTGGGGERFPRQGFDAKSGDDSEEPYVGPQQQEGVMQGGEGPVDPDSQEYGPVGQHSYDLMEYSDLQRLAKARTGDGSGGKAALIERLQEHDKSASSED